MTLLAALILIMMFNYYVTFFLLATTKTKGQGECPICGKLLLSVSKHLRLIHNLKNSKERAILNNLAPGRILVGGGQCPVVLCNANVLHLEKHLRAPKDITLQRIERELKSLKRTTAINQLAALRASNPDPPMVSQLDLDQEDAEEGSSGCQNPSCVNAQQRIRELEQEVQELWQDIQILRVSE